jgi:glycine cleavage system H protein
MEFPEDLKYTKEHEWVLVEGTVATVGISDYAQDHLGDVVYVELPAVGDKVSKEDAFGVVESVKAVSDVYAPVTGQVLEVNDDLQDNPAMINEDPYGDGWLIKVQMSDPDEELQDLLTAAEYQEYIAEQEEEPE